MTDIVKELLDFTTRDHERGCTGREYVCSCGYDQDIEAAVKKAAYEIERLRVVLSTARVDGMEMAAKHHDDCAAEHEACGWESQHHEMMAREHRRFASAIRKAKENGE